MKIQLQAEGYELKAELEKYADIKITDIAKAIPRKLRAVASWQAEFKQVTHKGIKRNTCILTLTVGEEMFRAEETTQHMYAALDVAAVHIEHQLQDYLVRLNPDRKVWKLP